MLTDPGLSLSTTKSTKRRNERPFANVEFGPLLVEFFSSFAIN
jgi:hypothetical protein